MSARPGTSVATQAALVLRDLDAEGRDELADRLARAGYKPELARKTDGGMVRATEAYKAFQGIPPYASGREVLDHARRPRCSHPDRDWLDPDTGEPIAAAHTLPESLPRVSDDGLFHFTVGWQFGRGLPDSNDSLSPEQVVEALEATRDIYLALFNISLDLEGENGFERSNRYLIATGLFPGVLADQQLHPNRMPTGQRFRGRYNTRVAWSRLELARTDLHECGHFLGLAHHRGNNVMHPTSWDFPHIFHPDPTKRRVWFGDAETATMRNAIGYGPPAGKPKPPPGNGKKTFVFTGPLTGGSVTQIVEKPVPVWWVEKSEFSGEIEPS